MAAHLFPATSFRLQGAQRSWRTTGQLSTRRIVSSHVKSSKSQTIEAPSTETKYTFFTKAGSLVDATVKQDSQWASVEISTLSREDGNPDEAPPCLHWGLYRVLSSKWYHPKEVVVGESTPDSGTGAMRTAMSWDEATKRWTTSLTVPNKLLPLHLGMVVWRQDTQQYDGPSGGLPHFCVPLGTCSGQASPLGATVTGVAMDANTADATFTVNFAVFSRHATAMSLCLVRIQQGSGPLPAGSGITGLGGLELSLDPRVNHTGDVWHVTISGLRDLASLCWAWRAEGDMAWSNGNRFQPGLLLLDPYAPLALPVVIPEAIYKTAPALPPGGRSDSPMVIANLAACTQAFDWSGRQRSTLRQHALEDSVILEVDVARFSSEPEAARIVSRGRQGTFLGVLDRLDFIRATGATAVMLRPILIPGPTGTAPLSFFAPNPHLAASGGVGVMNEVKELVAALHGAGLEVLLQVEYCLTAEGTDKDGMIASLKGLDAAVYYRGDGSAILNTGHPVTRSLVLASLRYLATEYQVDGFVMLNAENLLQDRHGRVQDCPPLAEDVAFDPILRGLKVIAAVGSLSLLPRTGERGYPHWGALLQINPRFSDMLTSWLTLNTPGSLSAVATCLTGSTDLFGARWDADLPGNLAVGRRPGFGINCPTPLGDVDILSLLNPGENLERAEVLARTMLLVTLLAPGVPLISAASLSRPAMFRFAALVTEIRKSHADLLHPARTGRSTSVSWSGTYGGAEPDWGNSTCLTMRVADDSGRALLLGVNPCGGGVHFNLPGPPQGTAWRVLVDTSRPSPDDATLDGTVLSTSDYTLQPYAALLAVA